MNTRNVLAIIFCFILACAVFMPAAQADDWDQMTKLKFSEPVEIPGGILPAGSYWFVLQNNLSDRNIVQIFSADWKKLEATLITASTQRWDVSNETQIEFAERPHDKPEALLKWYYPDRITGHEFIYSARHENEFARDTKQDVDAQPLLLRASLTRP
ncbi:MAG: hypothetical protein WB711_07360 [Terriglobales bacterium]